MKNIFQRVNAVRKAIGYVQKEKSVSTGSGSYKAVTHDQVTALIRSHMIDAGIVCVPTLLTSTMHDKEVMADGSKAKQQRYDATYSFDFVNEDDPADRLTIAIESHAMDNADKAPGKALSYAKKYAVLKLFELETGEDEESRYQVAEFDVIPHLEKMESAETRAELLPIYHEAKKQAMAANNKDGIAAIDKVAKRVGEKFKEAANGSRH